MSMKKFLVNLLGFAKYSKLTLWTVDLDGFYHITSEKVMEEI
jgi:hypothetical protein